MSIIFISGVHFFNKWFSCCPFFFSDYVIVLFVLYFMGYDGDIEQQLYDMGFVLETRSIYGQFMVILTGQMWKEYDKLLNFC